MSSMLTAPTFANPTTVPIGSTVLTINSGTGAGTLVGTYVAENITFNRATNLIKRPNEIGGPNGFAMVDTFVEGSATIQIPAWTATQGIPLTGHWFTLTLNPLTSPPASMTSEYFAIHSVSQPFQFGEYLKVNISFIKLTGAP